MEEHGIAIPFDIEQLNAEVSHKVSKRIRALAVAFVTRCIDIILSLFGIVLLIPLSLVVLLQNIKNKDFGNIFYVQDRVGKNGKIFKMFKFRTMVLNADLILADMLKDDKIREEYERYRKIKFDPRLTNFGRILRKTSLDEFPQFINVLFGDMTLVGPRPYMEEEVSRMGTYYKYVIAHKPGITGIYQISGREKISFEDRLDMDYRYHYLKSTKLDFKIAMITMLVTLRRKATYGTYAGQTADSVKYLSKQFTLFLKRIIDIIGALVGIIILIPLTVVVWVMNMLGNDNGPLFYSHERIGKNGKHFKMYKFRSMCTNSQEILEKILREDAEARKEWEENQKLKNDPRITKIGSFLRKTSLDEFPQFINVLLGDMSLVGPRAVVDGEIEKFGNHKEEVLSVKPGITGYWAANGRSDTSYSERVRMETYYSNNISIFLDIEILFKTVISVLKKEGAV